MPVLMAVMLAATAAEPPPKALVLLGGYQTLGVDSKQVAELEKALIAALASRPVQLVPAEEADKLKKGLGLCGEDPACLASVGERAGARWVLGYGAGKVGAGVLVNLLLVDVESGKSAASAGTKSEPKAMAATAAPLIDELLKNVELVPKPKVVETQPPPPPVPAPADAPKTTVLVVAPDPQQPPVVVAAPEKGRPMKAAAIGAGIGAGVFLLTTIVLGLAAAGNYNSLNGKAPGDERDRLVGSQKTLNLAGDVMLGVSVAAGAATVVFAALDAAR